jgi:hypothetical protein
MHALTKELIPRSAGRRVASWLLALGFCNFVAYVIALVIAGGVPHAAASGSYYVRMHGVVTEVSPMTHTSLYWHGCFMVTTSALAVIAVVLSKRWKAAETTDGPSR